MGRKETEEAIADSRAGRVTQFGSVAELMADLNPDGHPKLLHLWPVKLLQAGQGGL